MPDNNQTVLTVEEQTAIEIASMTERAIEAGKYDLTASKDAKDAAALKQSTYYMLAVAARQGKAAIVASVLASVLTAVKADTVRRSFYETATKAVKVGESSIAFDEKSGFSNLYNKNHLGGQPTAKEKEAKAAGAYRKAHDMDMKEWNKLTNAEQAARILEGQAILDGVDTSEPMVLNADNVEVFARQIVAEYGLEIAAHLSQALATVIAETPVSEIEKVA